MKMRPPAYPLITVDPYFSVWCDSDLLNKKKTVHWTSAENSLLGFITVDGEIYRFMGRAEDEEYPRAEQIECKVNALSTRYAFLCGGIRLNAEFFTPLFADDLYYISRPVSYLRLFVQTTDGKAHKVSVKVGASEQLCLNKKGEGEVLASTVCLSGGLPCMKMGNATQNYAAKSGDNIRIDWGYFYLTAPMGGKVFEQPEEDMKYLFSEFGLSENKKETVLFAYDDIKSLNYFGTLVEACWKKGGKTIEQAITEAYMESDLIEAKCEQFAEQLYATAEKAGGEKYADLLSLAYRQVFAAHKLCYDENGEVIFISKECFSNGCAATVDVTYPSSPMFIYYNTELLKGMLRPIFRFAKSDAWEFDFAPHDVGTFPIVTGQVYAKKKDYAHYVRFQMPVEECGNMLIMMANICLKDNNTDFAAHYMDILEKWVEYLVKFGEDPDEQLCTDDFAGHLAHNCNLSLKAVMGIEGYAKICDMLNKTEQAEKYHKLAKAMAQSWIERAVNKDGSFRLAFDRKDTFSMKYNMIWDKVWGTKLFPLYVYGAEFMSYFKHMNVYGLPLDNRADYTKSDWYLWTACFAPDQQSFDRFITPLWNAYHVTQSRVPMTDWYDTFTAAKVGFQHRSVQGGLFLKLLMREEEE